MQIFQAHSRTASPLYSNEFSRRFAGASDTIGNSFAPYETVHSAHFSVGSLFVFFFFYIYQFKNGFSLLLVAAAPPPVPAVFVCY